METPPPAVEAAAPVRRGRRGYFLPGAIAMVALVLIALAVGGGDLDHSAPHALNGPDVASQIALGIQAEQNSTGLPSVTCPQSEPARSGVTFTCAVSGAGAHRTVYVTEIDSRGQVRWSFSRGQ